MMRKYAKEVHYLADDKKPCGLIKFIHSDDKEHTFSFATNKLTGDLLAWFDDAPPSINDTTAWIKSVIRDIHLKSKKVIKQFGDYQYKP